MDYKQLESWQFFFLSLWQQMYRDMLLLVYMYSIDQYLIFIF